MMDLNNKTDLIVFSFNHFGCTSGRTSEVVADFAEHRRVYFIEPAIIGTSKTPTYHLKKTDKDVTVIQPYLPDDISVFKQKEVMIDLLKELIDDENISSYTIWTDTPKPMPFIRNLNAEIIIYDCLRDYSITHASLEKELFEYADLVLTSGMSQAANEAEDLHYFPIPTIINSSTVQLS